MNSKSMFNKYRVLEIQMKEMVENEFFISDECEVYIKHLDIQTDELGVNFSISKNEERRNIIIYYDYKHIDMFLDSKV